MAHRPRPLTLDVQGTLSLTRPDRRGRRPCEKRELVVFTGSRARQQAWQGTPKTYRLEPHMAEVKTQE